jgi:hypothetical protein
MEYNYKVENDYVILDLSNRKGEIFKTIIDYDDLNKVINFKYKWYPWYNPNSHSWYGTSTIYKGFDLGKSKSRLLFLHRFVMNDLSSDLFIDHINNNSLDNRKNNLRIVKTYQNLRNRRSKNSNNITGYRNVALIDGLYVVQLQINGKNTRLKSFKNVDEAGNFAKEMRELYYGDFSGSN